VLRRRHRLTSMVTVSIEWARGDLNCEQRPFGRCWMVPKSASEQVIRVLVVLNDVAQIYRISTRTVEIR